MKVLFVCMGNICRSPTAEGVFRKMVTESPYAGMIDIDSAGTHGYHVGAPPDPRAVEHAKRRGYDLSALRARQVGASDVEHFDYVLVMDDINLRQLRSICPTRLQHKVELLLDYGGEEDENIVPDPYQGEDEDFEHALDLIEAGCEGLLEYIGDQLKRSGSLSKQTPRD